MAHLIPLACIPFHFMSFLLLVQQSFFASACELGCVEVEVEQHVCLTPVWNRFTKYYHCNYSFVLKVKAKPPATRIELAYFMLALEKISLANMLHARKLDEQPQGD